MSEIQRKLYVPQRYSAFDHISKIKEIAQPLFVRYAIIFIDYSRIYFDGSWVFFTSSSGITQFLFESGFTFLPYVNIQKKNSYYLLSSIKEFERHMSIIKENFYVDNLFAHVEKHDKYVDVYWYGSHSENTAALNFYVNNLDVIQNHSYHFNDKAKHLISDAIKNRIVIPNVLKKDYNDAFNRIKVINEQPMHLNVDGLRVSITNREKDCLELIIKGYTAKMIASNLCLSPRTIETHIEKIKLKLNCSSKAQLVRLLLHSRGSS